MDMARAIPFPTSALVLIRLPTAVAAASARAVDFDLMQTASAVPKLSEWPTVPDDVQTPTGVSAAEMRRAILPLSDDGPANMQTVIFAL